METTLVVDHAKENAIAHLASIVELYQARDGGVVDGETLTEEQVNDRVNEMPLCVEFRSGWEIDQHELTAKEYRITLSTGGPACAIFGDMDMTDRREEIKYQDWGTPMINLPLYDVDILDTEERERVYGLRVSALAWFCSFFCECY